MRLPIILDTDPGIDDAAAIAAALFAPELELQLMTTVAGNVSVEKTTRNALQLLHFWNADVPLAQGASMPLVRPLRDAASVHGESGMEGYDFVEHQRQPLAKPAFQAIRDALMHAAEPITLVAIGPLTNIALLLTQYPECVQYSPAGDHGRLGGPRQLYAECRIQYCHRPGSCRESLPQRAGDCDVRAGRHQPGAADGRLPGDPTDAKPDR